MTEAVLGFLSGAFLAAVAIAPRFIRDVRDVRRYDREADSDHTEPSALPDEA